jgi:hypothetical protein
MASMTIAPSPQELGKMLYRLAFPKRDFAALSESVQRAYVQDATRLLAMMQEQS